MICDYAPRFLKKRWGRIGIEFSKIWNPNIFAGIIVDPTDHRLMPLDNAKGSDFVVFLESSYDENYDKNKKLSNKWFRALANHMRTNDYGFSCQQGIPHKPYRLIVLRKSLYDVIDGTNTREECKERIKENIRQAINMLLEAEKL